MGKEKKEVSNKSADPLERKKKREERSDTVGVIRSFVCVGILWGKKRGKLERHHHKGGGGKEEGEGRRDGGHFVSLMFSSSDKRA